MFNNLFPIYRIAFSLFHNNDNQQDPPELPIPNGHEQTENESEIKQVWSSNGESCPNGTIPIRRTTASEILAFSSISKFGKKMRTNGLEEHEVPNFNLICHIKTLKE